MALVTRRTDVTVETISAAHASQTPSALKLVAGEALDPAAPCRITASGVFMTDATAADALANVHGWTGQAYAIGEPVTLWGRDVIFQYSTGLTPGAILYAGATKGRLDTAATVGDAVGVALVVSATHIRTTRDI